MSDFDGTARVNVNVRARNGSESWTLAAQTSKNREFVGAVATSRDERWSAIFTDGTTFLFTIGDTLQLYLTFAIHQLLYVKKMAVDEFRLAVYSADGRLLLWFYDRSTGWKLQRVKDLSADPCAGLEWHPHNPEWLVYTGTSGQVYEFRPYRSWWLGRTTWQPTLVSPVREHAPAAVDQATA